MLSPISTILFVDDSLDILLLHRLNFERLGYRVLTAATPEAALESFKTERPAATIIDVVFAGAPDTSPNGFELCRRLHEIDPLSVLIIVTGMPDVEYNHQRGLHCGASRVLRKPVMDDELHNQVQTAVARINVPAMKVSRIADDYLKAVVVFILLGLAAWSISNRISDSRWQGKVEAQQDETNRRLHTMKDDTDLTWAYIFELRNRMIDAGLRPPAMPTRPNYEEPKGK